MIYLDNAATSYPKPLCVRQVMVEALCRFGANPGRGGYAMSMDTAQQLYRARQTVADFFGVPDPSLVAFTGGCTLSLNMAIQGLARPHSRVVTSCYEHNAVMRPLAALEKQGVTVVVVPVNPADDNATVAAFSQAITPDTSLVVCTHASNVTGEVLPIRRIGALAREKGVPFVVDAAQTAGMLPIHMQHDHIDFLCVPGHKGLYAPMGIGLLCSSGHYPLRPLICGGTGSRSTSFAQPEEWPDAIESGTVNVPGALALAAGMRWLRQRWVTGNYHREMALTSELYEQISRIPGVKVYGLPPAIGRHVPLLSLTVRDIPSEEVAALLGDAGIAVRAGLHCAPSAHREIGTLSYGTVRLALSAFTTSQEIQKTCEILAKISK